MSKNNNTMATQAGGASVKKISEAVIRIAGNSQDGIQAIGGFLARLAGRSEQEVITFMTIPSTISGGPSIFQVRIGSGEIMSAGDQADVLLAFYQHSYDEHMASLKQGGIVLYDADQVQPKPEWLQIYRHIGVPITSRTVEAIGGTAKDKGKNIYALGLVARMFDLDVAKLEDLIRERFSSKDPSVVNNALTAFHAGYNQTAQSLDETFQFIPSTRGVGRQVVMSGNEALSYGFIAAGVRFGAAYPITPASDIMELLRRELPKYGGTYVQCEDEIASICTALGASYAGRVAITTSSGPGISLKMEALGWGVMAEVPLVIVDVQRGGPSTGLPTQVEQSDLNTAVFGSHGDAPRVVLAPLSVEDCFYTAIEAVNLARQYSVPVFILSDQAIATRIEAFPMPDLEKVCQELPLDLTPVQEYKPYDLNAPDGISRHIAPGTPVLNGKYPVAAGLEHDEMGHPTGSPKYHRLMTAKRRHKLQVLAQHLPKPSVHGPEEGDVLLVSWGASWGPTREAINQANAAGNKFAALPMRYLWPFPDGLDKIFSRFKHIFVVEMNDSGIYGYGQLTGLLRARFCDARIRSINKTEGTTFKVKEILELTNAALVSA